jgi:hypothetical protein
VLRRQSRTGRPTLGSWASARMPSLRQATVAPVPGAALWQRPPAPLTLSRDSSSIPGMVERDERSQAGCETLRGRSEGPLWGFEGVTDRPSLSACSVAHPARPRSHAPRGTLSPSPSPSLPAQASRDHKKERDDKSDACRDPPGQRRDPDMDDVTATIFAVDRSSLLVDAIDLNSQMGSIVPTCSSDRGTVAAGLGAGVAGLEAA